MPITLPDDLAWSQDATLNEDQRWRAFKAWEAEQRLKFNQSSRAQEEYAAWLAAEPRPELGKVRASSLSPRKVYRIS